MSPRPRVTPPAVQMRELLAVRRCEGLDFHRAWNRSLREIDWPVKHGYRRQWQTALAATRPEWEAAFDGTATALSDAVESLRDKLAGSEQPPPEERMYMVSAV